MPLFRRPPAFMSNAQHALQARTFAFFALLFISLFISLFHKRAGAPGCRAARQQDSMPERFTFDAARCHAEAAPCPTAIRHASTRRNVDARRASVFRSVLLTFTLHATFCFTVDAASKRVCSMRSRCAWNSAGDGDCKARRACDMPRCRRAAGEVATPMPSRRYKNAQPARTRQRRHDVSPPRPQTQMLSQHAVTRRHSFVAAPLRITRVTHTRTLKLPTFSMLPFDAAPVALRRCSRGAQERAMDAKDCRPLRRAAISTMPPLKRMAALHTPRSGEAHAERHTKIAARVVVQNANALIRSAARIAAMPPRETIRLRVSMMRRQPPSSLLRHRAKQTTAPPPPRCCYG